MTEKATLSDELLNAFVDGELDPADEDRILGAAYSDKALSQRVCDLHHVKDLTQHAYRTEAPLTPSNARHNPERGRKLARAMAASLLLAAGVVVGWVANSQVRASAPHALAANDQAGLSPVSKSKNIILHLSSGAPNKVEAALDAAEDLARGSRGSRQKVKLEIIANSDGLDMLRADVSPYAKRVAELMQRYPNITFMACDEAIHKLEQKGIHVKLLPHTQVAPSAVEQIIKRVEDGWIYMKV